MHRHQRRIGIMLAALALVTTVSPAQAQLGRLRDRVQQRVEEKVRARPASTEAAGESREAAEPAPAEPAGATSGTAAPFVNFDFVPGERVLFAEDFSRDDVGDFPQRLELISGNGEVAIVAGQRFLRAPGDLTFALPLPEALPQRFTLEMDVMAPGFSVAELYLAEGGEEAYERDGKARATIGTHPSAGTKGGLNTYDSRSTETQVEGVHAGTPFTVRLMADGRYVKMYVAGTRVANAPNFDVGRGQRIIVNIPGSSLGGHEGTYITNIRVAAGGRDLYEALAANGRTSVHGILFDTGSDRIRPESAPTLQQIGDMLRSHAELRLRIEGHTDDVGADAANQQLSERRAAAVKQYLVERFGIAAARLESQGMGETHPVAPNSTPEGRQQNRRVELVRL